MEKESSLDLLIIFNNGLPEKTIYNVAEYGIAEIKETYYFWFKREENTCYLRPDTIIYFGLDSDWYH